MNKNNRKKPLLFEKYPKLEEIIPWRYLAPLKTPVRKLEKIAEYLGIDSLWIKLDNLSSPIYGGNKPRKLEFLLADAIQKNCDKILTLGGIGSNHCVATAAFCKELNLKSYVALTDQPVTNHVRRNLLLEIYFGSEIIYSPSSKELNNKISKTLSENDKIYFIGKGGSTPLGALGFVNAALELKHQIEAGSLPEPDYLFVANGSTGTTAGLSIGLKLADLNTKIMAIRVTPKSLSARENTIDLALKSKELIDKAYPDLHHISFEHLEIFDEYFGGEYGKPTAGGLEAIKLMSELENIMLEPTYTGKTFGALIDYVSRQDKDTLEDKTFLFWNTFNSRDFSDITKNIDYHNLPKELHWVFEKPMPTYD
ncbi:MAG: pyridoxal-phosphate dependent enzyme [Candidatus Lokiarchaeota archaeon]|nr:pyridoxal-phosphate dependent enzyme [Candidatus Lokiarchaeota archaeon]MBD3337840.1 pyridoxal-phosphate dependent enzyme [Candidatus Lokiarchaeota archaeon]